MRRANTIKPKWNGPKHLKAFEGQINKWPINPFTAPVIEVKTFFDGFFDTERQDHLIEEAMDPYYFQDGVDGADHMPDACPPGWACPLSRHLKRLFVGPATSAQLVACQDVVESAVTTGKVKTAKVAERNKAKRKAQKTRRKAAAAEEATNGPLDEATAEGKGENSKEGAGAPGETIVELSTLATLPGCITTETDNKRKDETNASAKNDRLPHDEPNTQLKPVAPTTTRNPSQLVAGCNPFCPVCSPQTSLVRCFKDTPTYDPLRDRPCCTRRLGVYEPCPK
ncbi:uncharacterized protein LOC62_07G009479 [Vanrija pseudolonga]|uniref:Uncharacterized protein n=1 Tax=Vanrija pseudolonga TaxID=143232 RepID=A0AAF1BLK1_9TREE|nr:hypothetical protein LOC62_07G009479 [Vanrija pseudolonga]